MEEKKITNPNIPYYLDVDIRMRIDECQHKIAALNAQLGRDNKDSTEGHNLKHKIKVLMAEIKILDPSYFEIIHPER